MPKLYIKLNLGRQNSQFLWVLTVFIIIVELPSIIVPRINRFLDFAIVFTSSALEAGALWGRKTDMSVLSRESGLKMDV